MVLGSLDGMCRQRPTEGDKVVFERAYHCHSIEIARYLGRILGRDSVYDVDDLLHDTFIKLADELRRGTKFRNLRDWLYRVARNRALEINRRAASRTDILRKIAKELCTEEETLGMILKHEEKQNLREAVAQLPPQLQDVLYLRFYRGESYEGMAEILNLTKDAVNHRLRRALEKLREALGDGLMEAAI